MFIIALLAVGCQFQPKLQGSDEPRDAGSTVDAQVTPVVDAVPMPDAQIPQLTLQRAGDSPQTGGTNGTVFDDACASDEVVIGFSGENLGVVTRMAVHCGRATLVADSPGRIAVATEPTQTLPLRGGTEGTPWSRLCPDDRTVIGITGRSGSDIDQLVVRCGKLVAQLSPQPVFQLEDLSELPPVGGGGGDPFGPFDCPVGQVTTVAHIRGGIFVAQLSIGCSSLVTE